MQIHRDWTGLKAEARGASVAMGNFDGVHKGHRAVIDAARDLDRAISLPLFALRAEHVLDDLPQALDQAGFTGPRLDPVGLAPEVPAMIAASIAREVSSLK